MKNFWGVVKRNKGKFIGLIILLILLYVALGTSLPYHRHKDVSEEFANSFDIDNYFSDEVQGERVACIDDNIDALLWRLRIIEQAKT